ncbi:MAG TPA: hypothetical protein VJR89_18775, partial [Polyangiales bacterium]|nr:hypothetical protein [Polyangiales bacterium]
SACSADGPSAAEGGGGQPGRSAGAGGTDFGNPSGLAGVSGASLGGPAPAGSGSGEVCDGMDNDANGITDDVDAENDGVCDCLNIATIGQIGPWSDGGNVFKQWLDARSPRSAVELGDQVLSDELLRPFQVIVVLYAATFEFTGNGQRVPAHHAFSDAEVAAFRRWVEAGGGVMTTIGYTSDETREVENVNRLIAPLGVAYATNNDAQLDGPIRSWADHPLATGVRNITVMNGVAPLASGGVTVARDSANHPALQAAQAQAGHLVVWGDEWITYDSQWVMVQDQQVERLWLNVLKWLSPAKVCQVPIKGPE